MEYFFNEDKKFTRNNFINLAKKYMTLRNTLSGPCQGLGIGSREEDFKAETSLNFQELRLRE